MCISLERCRSLLLAEQQTQESRREETERVRAVQTRRAAGRGAESSEYDRNGGDDGLVKEKSLDWMRTFVCIFISAQGQITICIFVCGFLLHVRCGERGLRLV